MLKVVGKLERDPSGPKWKGFLFCIRMVDAVYLYQEHWAGIPGVGIWTGKALLYVTWASSHGRPRLYRILVYMKRM